MRAIQIQDIELSHIQHSKEMKEENYYRVAFILTNMLSEFRNKFDDNSIIIYIDPYLAKISNLDIGKDSEFMGVSIQLGRSSPINYIRIQETDNFNPIVYASGLSDIWLGDNEVIK